MKTLLVTLGTLFVIAILWIRYVPLNRDTWHNDPADMADPGRSGMRLIGREAPRYPTDPDTVLTTFHEIVMAETRTHILEGDLDEGMITFVRRSKVFGFPDLITVKAVSEGPDLTKLSISSRSKYGWSDWGLNGRRLDRWLQEMRLRLGEAG